MQTSKRASEKFFVTARGVFFHDPGTIPPRLVPIRLRATVSVQGVSTKFAVVQFRDYDGQFACVTLPRADFMAFHQFKHTLENAGYKFPV